MAENAIQIAESKQVAEKGKINYQVAGEAVELTTALVRKCLVRGDQNKVADGDIWSFMCMCKFNQLNPFLNEAYLVQYGSNTQMIVGKEAFMKRADACPDYEGFEAGVIVMNKNGEIKDAVGNFVAPGETLVGGWAIIYRKGRKPVHSRVSFIEYNTKQSNWVSKPATMISKVAKVQGLREAFPNQLGAMYTEDEMGAQKPPIEDAVATEIKEQANTIVIPATTTEAPTAPAAEAPQEKAPF